MKNGGIAAHQSEEKACRGEGLSSDWLLWDQRRVVIGQMESLTM